MVMPSTLEVDPRVDPLIGQTLGGKYTLERMIGRGGMGHVYAATVTDPNGDIALRDVVVKMIAPPLAQQPQAMARFEREAKRLDSLRHSNIVEMYDYGREGGRAYIVMEWVDGELLSDYMGRKGRLTLADYVPVAAQILKGVGHAHSRDLMIRDIKPANVMLCERKGRANFVKIIDFGLAKMLEGDEDITKQHFIGTSGYLSPEQIKGLDIDLRVDVYALGVLFYQMLSGRMPFEAENDTTLLYKHVHDFPTPLSEVLPDGHEVPEELVHLIHDCLEKDRDDRPRDANEIVERLIDCVPMSMFKLPPVTASASEQTEISALSTTALNAPSGETASYLSRAALGSTAGDSTAGDSRPQVAAASGGHPITSSTLTQPAPSDEQGKSKRLAIILLAGVAALAVLVTGVVLISGQSSNQSSNQEASAAQADAKVSAHVEATVEQADVLVGAGEFKAAARELDTIRTQLATASPGLSARVERLDRKIEVAKLLETAQQLDEQRRTGAAIRAYEEVLALAPGNTEAEARIVELRKILEAENTIEISGEDQPEDQPEPNQGSSKSEKKPPSKPKSGAVTDSSVGAPAKPEPEPEAAKPKPDKSDKENPFLSTKKKTENGPFLPTEK